MESMSSKPAIGFYYGKGNLKNLANYETVILQPEHYSAQEIKQLAKISKAYAYISLTEDSAKSGPWQLKERNLNWDTAYVDIGSSLWHEHILKQAASYFAQGFQGLFLDTLDAIDKYPEQRNNLLQLICKLKELAKNKALIANRGFSLMPELQNYVSAIVFEGFSCIWANDGSYRSLKADELAWTKKIAKELQASGLDIYALDYAEAEYLKEFAKKRANSYGFISLISNRELTKI